MLFLRYFRGFRSAELQIYKKIGRYKSGRKCR